MAVTVLVAGGLFWFFLAKHQPLPGWIALAAGLVALWQENRRLPGLRERSALRHARREGRRLVRSVRAALRKQRTWMSSDAAARLDSACDQVLQAAAGTDAAAIDAATRKLDETADAHLTRKSARREYVEQIGGAILAALLLRAFAWEAFRIPSSSMVPTLLIGDHLFVNKFVYGIRVPFTLTKFWTKVPERGAIVVFNDPRDPSGDDIIKRVVGLPGDVVQVRDRRITINGEPLATRPDGEALLLNSGDPPEPGEHDEPLFRMSFFHEKVGEYEHLAAAIKGRDQAGSEGAWTVRPGHVFVMGDNRDNSGDSRIARPEGFGQVPLEYIKGRADVIWLSLGGPHGVRFSRMFTLIR